MYKEAAGVPLSPGRWIKSISPTFIIRIPYYLVVDGAGSLYINPEHIKTTGFAETAKPVYLSNQAKFLLCAN